MFTGIIEEVGRVTGIAHQNGNRRLTVAATRLNQELKKGDSIAVSGVCLTAVDITPDSFAADLAAETWKPHFILPDQERCAGESGTAHAR